MGGRISLNQDKNKGRFDLKHLRKTKPVTKYLNEEEDIKSDDPTESKSDRDSCGIPDSLPMSGTRNQVFEPGVKFPIEANTKVKERKRAKYGSEVKTANFQVEED